MPENHYVQIIHGTWNPPSTQEPRWHQSSSTDPNNFAARLDALFGQYGMSGAVWRKWQEGEASFAWSGANQHADRIEAGDRLFQTWLDLLEHDPAARIHIVAHSHGANVTLRALERYLEYLSSQAARVFNRVLNACLHAEPSKAITIALAEMFGEHATVIHDQSRNSLDELQKLGSYLHRSGRNLKRKEWHRIDRGDSVWFDHFPEHVTTLRRSTWLQFRKAWVGSRGTNRIGALVFLGAPFFRKVWKLTTWWSPANVVRIIVDAIVSVFLGVSFAYVVETVLFSVLWLLLSPFTFIFGYGSFYHPGVNPFEWPPLLQVVVGGFAFLFTWGFFLECLKRTHRAINLYFDEERLGRSPIDGDNVPFDTLVIHAEMLDEVVLGFSAEPLVYGALRPQIHTVLYGRALFNWPRFPSGYEAHAWDWISAYLGSIFWALVALILMPFRPVAWIWEQYIAKKLIQLISSPTFGLQADEFVGAAILTRPQLALPKFFKEYDWDVTELLICSPSVERNTTEDRRARYAFLWNEAELKERLSGSWLWKQRELWKDEIRSYYSPFQAQDVRAFDDQQQKTCLILEERLRELVGVVELIHSSYYTNPEIIPAIARFIATREPPEASRPLQAGQTPSDRIWQALWARRVAS